MPARAKLLKALSISRKAMSSMVKFAFFRASSIASTGDVAKSIVGTLAKRHKLAQRFEIGHEDYETLIYKLRT